MRGKGREKEKGPRAGEKPVPRPRKRNAAYGLTVRVALFVTPKYVAETTGFTVAVTALVWMVKLAVWAPAATVTVAGTEAVGSLLVSATTAPPAGARPLSTTAPVAFPP